MPVSMVVQTMTRDEIDSWLSYFVHKDPDPHEVQMAILIANVRNAMKGKKGAASKVVDFIISKKPKKKVKRIEGTEDMIQIGKYQPIKKSDLHKYLK